jgi:hypothetical protein
VTDDLWTSVCVVDVDEGNNERVCDDVLDMEKNHNRTIATLTRGVRYAKFSKLV